MPQYPYGAFNEPATVVSTLAAASANGNSGDLTNLNHRGVQVVVQVTALAGTSPTITVTIQGKDPVEGTYYTLLASSAISATGYTRLTVYPGGTASANAEAAEPLPLTYRIEWALGGTSPVISATISKALLV